MKSMVPAGLVLLSFSCWIVSCSDEIETVEDMSAPDTPTPPPQSIPSPPENAPAPDMRCTNGRIETVLYAIDGDTIALDNDDQEHVRFIGMDTPELYGDGGPECYAQEAADTTDARVGGVDVCLIYDPAVEAQSGNIDYYGRTLAYVFFGDGFERFLNAELIEEGYAYDYPYTDGAAYEEYFAELEAYAFDAGLGLWSACSVSP